MMHTTIPPAPPAPLDLHDMAERAACTCEYLASIAEAVQLTLDDEVSRIKTYSAAGLSAGPPDFRLATSLLNCLGDQARSLSLEMCRLELHAIKVAKAKATTAA